MDLQTDRKAVARTAARCGLRSVRLPALLLRLALRTTKSETNAPQPNKKANGNVIIGNVVDNAGDNGIEVNSSDGNEITGNRVTNSSDDRSGFDGIRISSMDSITCDSNRVESNVATDNSPVKHMLLKFTVSGVAGRTVTSAKLRLYCADPSDVGGVFFRVQNTSWSENTVTWNTAPAADASSFASLGSVTTGSWYEVNVPFVTADGTYAVKVTSSSSNGADYASKEGTAGTAPQLVVTAQ